MGLHASLYGCVLSPSFTLSIALDMSVPLLHTLALSKAPLKYVNTSAQRPSEVVSQLIYTYSFPLHIFPQMQFHMSAQCTHMHHEHVHTQTHTHRHTLTHTHTHTHMFPSMDLTCMHGKYRYCKHIKLQCGIEACTHTEDIMTSHAHASHTEQ